MAESQTDCALYLARGPELTIIWANDEYASLLGQDSGSAVVGMRLDEVSPLASIHGAVLREVMLTGEVQEGEDRRFSVEDGTLVLRWRAYRPMVEHVLVVILACRGATCD